MSEGQACNISSRGKQRRSRGGVAFAVITLGCAIAVVAARAPLPSILGVGFLAWMTGEYLFQVREKT